MSSSHDMDLITSDWQDSQHLGFSWIHQNLFIALFCPANSSKNPSRSKHIRSYNHTRAYQSCFSKHLHVRWKLPLPWWNSQNLRNQHIIWEGHSRPLRLGSPDLFFNARLVKVWLLKELLEGLAVQSGQRSVGHQLLLHSRDHNIQIAGTLELLSFPKPVQVREVREVRSLGACKGHTIVSNMMCSFQFIRIHPQKAHPRNRRLFNVILPQLSSRGKVFTVFSSQSNGLTLCI